MVVAKGGTRYLTCFYTSRKTDAHLPETSVIEDYPPFFRVYQLRYGYS